MFTFKNILLFLVLQICLVECAVLYQKAGADITLECPGVAPKGDIEWKFKDRRIVKIIGGSGPKLRGELFPQGSKKYYPDMNTLKISRLETSDSGRYSCTNGREFIVQVVSAFVTPGTVLPQDSDAELHCNEGDTKEVQWLKPPNAQLYPVTGQTVHLKSLTLNDDGQWTCQVQGLQINITLTVVGLQTKEAIEVPQGDNVVLPCSLPQMTSRHVVGGKWEADHLPEVSSATLKITDKTLQWMGRNSSRVMFTSGRLGINYDIKLINVQPSDAGRFVCTVEFDGGTKLTASTMLKVVPGTSGKTRVASVNGSTSKWKEPWTKNVLGVQVWIWIAVGASSVVLIGVIIGILLVQRRNKRMKKRVRQLKSMRQPLTAKDYCHCDRSEREEELVKQARPVTVPRHQRNINKTKQNHITERHVY